MYIGAYIRQIRMPDGKVLYERGVASEGTHNTVGYTIGDAEGNLENEIGHDYAPMNHTPIDYDAADHTMPAWWQPPSKERFNKLASDWAAEKNAHKPLPVTRNVVTFGVSRRNGSMMGQFRSFVSQQGKPIGNPGMPSMHGGLMESNDKLAEAIREIKEEFGIVVETTDLDEVGHLYDPENGRFNHVYRVLTPYEDALIFTHGHNVEAIMAAILNCEGLGRFSNMFKLDVQRAMEIGALTPISIAILRAFPQLMPPTEAYAV